MKCFTDQTIERSSPSITEYFVSADHNVREIYAIGKSLPIRPYERTYPVAKALASVEDERLINIWIDRDRLCYGYMATVT